jgi:4-hydroxy-tetrahydrodipicolinate synthase
LNESEYRRHIRWLAEKGLGFIQPLAATGQVMQSSEEEYKRILEITVEELEGKVIITAYSGRPSTAETIKLTKLAQDIGCDAAYIIQPFFTRPDPEGIYLHYRSIAEAVPDFPLVFYNNPSRAGVTIPLDVMRRLVTEFDNFAGLKQSDIEAVADSYGMLRDRIVVWPKSEIEILYALAMGSPGVLTFAANVVPGELVDIVAAWNQGDLGRAREIYFQLLPLFNIIHIEAIPAAIKYMLNKMGWDFGKPRLPIHEVSKENAEKIDKVLKDLELI